MLTRTEEGSRACAEPNHTINRPLDNVAFAPLLTRLVLHVVSVELILAVLEVQALVGPAQRRRRVEACKSKHEAAKYQCAA